MSTRKQRIRLTESDLRNIVKESARQIISEFNWKTYANAAKKAANKSSLADFEGLPAALKMKKAMRNKRRSEEFANKAGEMFDSEFGYRDKDNAIRLCGLGDDYDAVGYRYHRPEDSDTQLYARGYRSPAMSGMCGGGEETPEEFFGNDDIANKYSTAKKEVDAFNNGDYEYQKGKGWQLKNESLNRIVRESINRIVEDKSPRGIRGYIGLVKWLETGKEDLRTFPYAPDPETAVERERNGVAAKKFQLLDGPYLLTIKGYKFYWNQYEHLGAYYGDNGYLSGNYQLDQMSAREAWAILTDPKNGMTK